MGGRGEGRGDGEVRELGERMGLLGDGGHQGWVQRRRRGKGSCGWEKWVVVLG